MNKLQLLITDIDGTLLNTQKSFAVITNGTLKGGENLTDKEKEVYKRSLEISDKMIRANSAHNN